MKFSWAYIWKVLQKAGNDFAVDNGFKSSAALSFYTLFSIAPIVIITIFIASLFVDDKTIRDEITQQFQSLVGQEGAEGVFVLMETLRTNSGNKFSLIFGIILLIFSATTIFVMLQSGFNEIFQVRPRAGKKGYLKLLRDRVISAGMVFSLGLIMLVSLMLDTVIISFTKALSDRFKDFSVILLELLQNGLILGLAFLVIFALFRFLPDAVLHRKLIFRGALFTTILLLIGKFAIGWYIGNSNLSRLAGASSSIIILMLWVYYSSVILFFGAELIKAQSIVSNIDYKADKYARKIKIIEIDDEN